MGQDPLEFKLGRLKINHMRNVPEAAAPQFGWIPPKTPGERGYGIAGGMASESWGTTVAEVETDRVRGRIAVKCVVCAQEMGQVVSPREPPSR